MGHLQFCEVGMHEGPSWWAGTSHAQLAQLHDITASTASLGTP